MKKTYNVKWEKILQGSTVIRANSIEEAYKIFNETEDVNVEEEYSYGWQAWQLEGEDGEVPLDELNPEIIKYEQLDKQE